MPERKTPLFWMKQAGLAGLLLIILTACSLSLDDLTSLFKPSSPAVVTSSQAGNPANAAVISFRVTLPAPLLPAETLYLAVLDELTGLGLNQVTYSMQGMDATHYEVSIPFAIGSLVKYRYLRQGTFPIMEDDTSEAPVRYRLYQVASPGIVDDVVSSWTDSLFSSPTGRITGQVVDAINQFPVRDILVTAGGQQTLTDATGAFYFEALPAGIHNLVAVAIDGTHLAFQQGARVEAEMVTPVLISMQPARLVNVIFNITVPSDTVQNAPLRLAGSLYSEGEMFADLQGGMNTIASRLPQCSPTPDGHYTISLFLPEGMDFRYKYTLGDGFWNAEHDPDGQFAVRQLIIPYTPDPYLVQDVIQSWHAGTSAPLLFDVTVPANTPVGDTVSIQFKPFGWTEPIPMWSLGNNHWVYQLYGPLNMFNELEYRYCRNDQCGVADDLQTASGQPGRLISLTTPPQSIQDVVTVWSGLPEAAPASIAGLPVNARQNFLAGMEFLPTDPAWQPWLPLALQDVQGRYSNLVVLAPTWSVGSSSSFTFEPVPGHDSLWVDTLGVASRVIASGMQVAIFPAASLLEGDEDWWISSRRDADWWDAWFDRYQAFIESHAQLATTAGAKYLILGGDWVSPALQNGMIGETASNVPPDANSRWQAILDSARSQFSGSILWALPYHGGTPLLPEFADELDGIYLLWSAPLEGDTVDVQSLSAGSLLDEEILPHQERHQKPVILAAAYGSFSDSSKASLAENLLFQPGWMDQAVDLQTQADAYQALFMAINERPWIAGFVSRGYYPPAALQDASASVHGKPAADLLWYWYPRFLGITQ